MKQVGRGVKEDIEDIQMFGLNMTFISSSEVKKCIFHECRRQECNIHFFTSLDEIKVIFTLFFLLYTSLSIEEMQILQILQNLSCFPLTINVNKTKSSSCSYIFHCSEEWKYTFYIFTSEKIAFSKYAFYFINNSLYFITLYIIKWHMSSAMRKRVYETCADSKEHDLLWHRQSDQASAVCFQKHDMGLQCSRRYFCPSSKGKYWVFWINESICIFSYDAWEIGLKKYPQSVHFHKTWGSENDKVKVEKGKNINLKIISKPRALLQTWEKTCAKFQKDQFKILWEVAITRYPLSIHLRSENDKVQKVEKSDKK